jgi:hypothetical protein
MYRIEVADFGYRLTFGGIVSGDEMKKWWEDSVAMLAKGPDRFSVFVDMHQLETMSRQAQMQLEEGQRHYKNQGMVRSVVILSRPVIKRQLEILAKASGIHHWERYIDASTTPDWEERAMAWLKCAIEPESNHPELNLLPRTM